MNQLKDNLSYAWKILFSLMYVFVATFVVFPGCFFAERVKFLLNNQGQDSGFKIIIFILTFNVFDTLGRKLAGSIHLSSRIIMIGSIARTIFIPSTILLAMKQDDDIFLFETDAFRFINLILFSLTNGYISTQCCIKAPSFVPKQQQE